jgi:hypothetical protein
VAHLYYWRFHPKWGINGWMNRWMDGSNNHPQIWGEPQGTQVIFLACLYWRFHRQWGMDGWMDVCMNKGGKFNHPQIWWESQGN